MSEEKKVYCGSGKVKSPKWIKATLRPDVLKDFIEDYKGNKYVKIDINLKDSPDQYGKDVSITIDTWKPESKQETPAHQEPSKQVKEEETDDLPF